MHSSKTSPPRQSKDIVMIALVAAAVLVGVVLHGLLAVELLGEQQKRLEEKAEQSYVEHRAPSGPASALAPPVAAVPEPQPPVLRAAESPPVASSPSRLSEAEDNRLKAFGLALAKAINERDASTLKAQQNSQAFVDRVCQNISTPVSEPWLKFLRADDYAKGWLGELTYGEATFVRTRECDGLPSVLLRINGPASVDYFEVLVKSQDFSYRAVDIYLHWAGVLRSQTMSRALKSRESARIIDPLSRTFAAWTDGRSEEVLSLYAVLPEDLKDLPVFYIASLRARSEVPDAEKYREMVQKAPAILGNENLTDFMRMDLCAAAGDEQGAAENLRRMDVALGGDAYLKCWRGDYLLGLGDLEGALALADLAEKAEPTLHKAGDLRIMVHTIRKDHQAVVNECRHSLKKFGLFMSRQNFENIERYQDLLASPEFAAWEKELEQVREAMKQFGRDLAQALTSRDGTKVAAIQDPDTLVERIAQLQLPSARVHGRKFVDATAVLPGGWMWGLMGADVQFSRIRARENETTLLLLVIRPSGPDYVEVVIQPGGAGYKAVDMYEHSTGELLSRDFMHSIMSQVLEARMRKLPEEGVAEPYSDLAGIEAARRAGNHVEVLRLYAALPSSIRQIHSLFTLRREAFAALYGEEAAGAKDQVPDMVEAANKLFGENKVPPLVQAHLLLMTGELAKAEDWYRWAEEKVGGLSYVKILRGHLRARLKDDAGAIALADELEKTRSKIHDPYYIRIAAHLGRGNAEAAVAEYRAFKKKFGDLPNPKVVANYAGHESFFASREYAAWQKEAASP